MKDKKPTDEVYIHIPVLRGERLAYKHACERQGITMEDEINEHMRRYVKAKKPVS